MIDDLKDEKLMFLKQMWAKKITTVILCGSEDGVSFASNVSKEETVEFLEFMLDRIHIGKGLKEEFTEQ
jgi:hypothetical protein